MKSEINRKYLAMPGSRLFAGATIAVALMVCSLTYAAADSDRQPPAPLTTHAAAALPWHSVWFVGSSFHPISSEFTNYEYASGGCIYMQSGQENRFVHKVNLPPGAIVRYMRLYAFDNSATDLVKASLWAVDESRQYGFHFHVESSNGGYVNNLSSAENYAVDYASKSLTVLADLGEQNDSSLQFCGVRIAYQLPSDDIIFQDGFEL